MTVEIGHRKRDRSIAVREDLALCYGNETPAAIRYRLEDARLARTCGHPEVLFQHFPLNTTRELAAAV